MTNNRSVTSIRQRGRRPLRVLATVLAVMALLISFTVALLGWPSLASGDAEASFGIRPTEADPERPETFSFFSHEILPGDTIEDAAIVENHGGVRGTAKIYLVDGVTAINGGTTFTPDGYETHGTQNWLNLEVGEVTLDPGQDAVVPFTISVPRDAVPGEHVAGLIVQDVDQGEIDGDGIGVAVIRRTGVAVLVDVPGVRTAVMDITGVGLNLQDDSGAVFLLDVRNDGNISLKGSGVLTIKDTNGNELATAPFDMDTILAEDQTSFYINSPILLEDGDYLIDARADYAASRGDERGTTAFLQNVKITVVDGQPEVEKTVPDPAKPPTVVSIGGVPEETETSVNVALIVAILGAIVLAAGATGTLVMRRRDPPTAG